MRDLPRPKPISTRGSPRMLSSRAACGPPSRVEAMRLADGVLASGSLRLLRLVEEDEDASWPVVAVPAASRAEIRSLAEALCHDATDA